MNNFPLAPLGTLISSPIADGPHTTPEFLSEGIPFLSVDGIQDGELVFNKCRFISPEDHDEFSKKAKPQKGDVLMGKADSTGKIALVRTDFEFSIWSPLAIIRSNDAIISDFLAFALKSIPAQIQIDNLCSYNTQKNIAMSDIPRIRIPLPPFETQQRIADYLDRETAEIDAAVADLDRYVELLEKRRLLTVDEVLHSSDLAVSGWPEMPLKLIIQERFVGDWGGEPGTADVDSVCVRVADFDRPTNTVNDQVPTTRSYSREKYEAKRLRHHDILVERSGGGEKTPVGSAMLYTGGNEALCANFIEVVRLKEDQLPEYWVHVLRREYMGRNTMRFVKQTTGIQNLDPQGFYDQKFRVPSFNEQRDLARELNSKTTEIDSLITESTKLRDLLLKRRSVLITDVVTGRKQV